MLQVVRPRDAAETRAATDDVRRTLQFPSDEKGQGDDCMIEAVEVVGKADGQGYATPGVQLSVTAIRETRYTLMYTLFLFRLHLTTDDFN